ncbi:hypothetical protein D0Z00_003311 [Geotrichum galactomycetum]|uniref:Uncharacterized protein n=1 Tax=Geotrichum galactomycetum TaxID=27317 RepID=A0ACB6V1J6_9ASCO|nr:hypothetical protein D0Z00_003311 [Geotrichum candidum]
MSGIVSLLFCGITLKHYAYYNMSRRTQIAVKYIFQLLAQLSENFIFIYLGLSLFTEVELIFKPILIIVTAVGICVSRYVAVFPLSRLINFVHSKRVSAFRLPNRDEEIPPPYQMMLFWAGLRGAVGVALAAGLTGEHASSLKATVLVVVVLTVIVFGGTTARMLEILGIQTGVIEEAGSDDEFDIESNLGKYNRPTNYQDGGNTDELDISDAESDVSDLPPMSSSQQQSQNVALNSISRPDVSSSSLSGIFSKTAEDPGKWFKEFDDHVLKPVLLDSAPSEDPNPNKK